ncbi:enoyl-CoA hydratase-related protein [Gordonia polyisoprenivorans]|uniref:enoyl-CoA hydratase-related protein n=1 Tax=Gordonia polyisoprenivorans TaxID=84595 RepID=UPI000B99D9E0|nr:enoyl-CoA hydratase-related protein [Gordonia polyisoprenivorans]OZC32123.1 enoyl-CoA hydratase [Gordonia polyisoprenivorans]
MTATLEITDGLATITLARPRAHNALDVETKTALRQAIEKVAGDRTVRAVLLVAEGKNFCVGQDLGDHVAELKKSPEHAMDTVADHYNPVIRALAGIEVPVIAAIRGACVGAGLGIALTADIRIASQNATFATAFAGIGLASDSGLSHHLVSMLGSSRATGLLMLGDRIDAAQALNWGLVHRVADDADMDSAAVDLARRLADGPTEAFRRIKGLVGAGADGLSAALDREYDAQRHLGATADHAAAVEAFLDKRTPEFSGR